MMFTGKPVEMKNPSSSQSGMSMLNVSGLVRYWKGAVKVE
jgi:hypothetical protein